MMTYRYSDDGIDRLLRKAQTQSLAVTTVAILAGFGVAASSMTIGQSLRMLPVFAVIASLALWAQRRSAGKIRVVVQSTTIEIDDQELKAGNSLATTAIRRQDVVELRYLRDGILVRSRDLSQTVQLKPELDQFNDLVRRLEEWVPAQAVRNRSATSFNHWVTGLTFGNIGLMTVGLSVDNPMVGIPACLAETLILLVCAIWVWRTKTVAVRLRWLMLMTAFPALSLMGRAYLLWNLR